MGPSANRGEIDENRREKRVGSKIIAPPTRLTMSSESDRSPQLAENQGVFGVSGHCGSSVQNYLSTHLVMQCRVIHPRRLESGKTCLDNASPGCASISGRIAEISGIEAGLTIDLAAGVHSRQGLGSSERPDVTVEVEHV